MDLEVTWHLYMMKTGHKRYLGFLLGLAWACPSGSWADEVMVVLGSDTQPYQEALAGFEEGYRGISKVMRLSEGAPSVSDDTRVIVAIGGKAALYRYDSPKALFIYCLAPGIAVDPHPYPRGLAQVFVPPPPEILLRQILILQPKLQRLTTIWFDDSAISYG